MNKIEIDLKDNNTRKVLHELCAFFDARNIKPIYAIAYMGALEEIIKEEAGVNILARGIKIEGKKNENTNR